MTKRSEEWLTRLRERLDMPPVGQSETDYRLQLRAESCFKAMFDETPEEVIVASGTVTIEHMDWRFSYEPDEDALYYQPLDTDGNPFERRVKIKDGPHAVHVLAGRKTTTDGLS